MDDTTILPTPTSNAATRETEPEVVAGISSSEGNPDLPLSFRASGPRFGWGGWLLVLGAGLAVGYGVSRWMQRRD
jgi:hypothetical protein